LGTGRCARKSSSRSIVSASPKFTACRIRSSVRMRRAATLPWSILGGGKSEGNRARSATSSQKIPETWRRERERERDPHMVASH
jgi:hypothetical protein